MKALIVAPSWIGDTIMAQPLFARLHAKHPGLQLDALAPSWVAPVLHRMDEITDVLDNPFGHGQLSLKARWHLARQLKAKHTKIKAVILMDMIGDRDLKITVPRNSSHGAAW